MKGKSMNPHQNPFAGNTPQDVTERQGENAIFIVYGLNQSPDAEIGRAHV